MQPLSSGGLLPPFSFSLRPSQSPHRVICYARFVLSDLGTWVTNKLKTFICLAVLEAGIVNGLLEEAAS